MNKGYAALLLMLMAVAFCQHTFAQGYRIEATLKGIKDSSCILGHYYNETQFVAKDTAKADGQGRMVFEGNKSLPGGLYLIVLPGKSRYIQLVMSGKENNFSIETDTANVVRAMKVKGSEENRIFYDFQNKIGEIVESMDVLNREKKTKTDPASAALIARKIEEKQQEFKKYRTDFLAKHQGTFTAELLKQSIEPEIPPAPKLPNGKQDSVWIFNYYKAHYWDNFNFADDRLLRTPFTQPKLERYMKQLVVQQPDSIIKEADYLVRKASASKDMKTYFIYNITNEYETTKVVGTEGVFVHMAEKYYLTGEMDISDDGRKKIKERVASMKPLLVNKIIPDLILSDTLRKPISIHSIKADYTVVVFYSPSCGHCKESAPKLKDFYDKNKATGVKVLAVATEQSPEEWKKFIHTYHLEDMLHGYDYNGRVNYYHDYDVVSTPTVYVLDKNKRIIARKMPVEQLDDFYNFYRNRQKTK